VLPTQSRRSSSIYTRANCSFISVGRLRGRRGTYRRDGRSKSRSLSFVLLTAGPCLEAPPGERLTKNDAPACAPAGAGLEQLPTSIIWPQWLVYDRRELDRSNSACQRPYSEPSTARMPGTLPPDTFSANIRPNHKGVFTAHELN